MSGSPVCWLKIQRPRQKRTTLHKTGSDSQKTTSRALLPSEFAAAQLGRGTHVRTKERSSGRQTKTIDTSLVATTGVRAHSYPMYGPMEHEKEIGSQITTQPSVI